MAHLVTSKVHTKTRTMNLNIEATGGPPKETSTFLGTEGEATATGWKIGGWRRGWRSYTCSPGSTRKPFFPRPPPHIAFIFQQSALPLNDSDRTPRFSPHPTTIPALNFVGSQFFLLIFILITRSRHLNRSSHPFGSLQQHSELSNWSSLAIFVACRSLP